MMKEDKQLLVVTHLSQLLDFVSGIGGFVVPLIIWIVKRDEIRGMNETGKSILNFRISMFVYAIICIPLILFFGLGILGLFILVFFYLIFPISTAIKVSNG